jgi:hypothetical protein
MLRPVERRWRRRRVCVHPPVLAKSRPRKKITRKDRVVSVFYAD